MLKKVFYFSLCRFNTDLYFLAKHTAFPVLHLKCVSGPKYLQPIFSFNDNFAQGSFQKVALIQHSVNTLIKEALVGYGIYWQY